MKISKEYERELNRIVDELFEAGYSQDLTWYALALRSGLSYRTILRLGNRETRLPQLRTVVLIAKAVGMTVTFTTSLKLRKAA